MWGIRLYTNRTAQGSLNFEWNIPANNPCPFGWRIPSMWNWWDIVSGSGTDINILDIDLSTTYPNNNNWQIRGVSSNSNAYGSVIVTNSANEKIFLPIMGFRYNEMFASNNGTYWFSTFSNESISTGFSIMPNTNTINFSSSQKHNGYCVRCVAEQP
jgi:uncharacterized protein (TIGR02145 family)